MAALTLKEQIALEAVRPVLQQVQLAAAQDATDKASKAQAVNVAPNLAALKASAGKPDTLTILMYRAAPSDGLGGTYYWDAASTEAEDSTYLNIIAPATGAGRWKRIIARVTVLPQGVLVSNNGVKTLYASASVVGSAGQATLNLTTDNTASGPAIFSEIWENTSMVKPPLVAANVEDNITCICQTEALKTTTHVAVRGSKTTLPSVATALLGLIITSQRYAPAGTVLRITVTGI